LCVTLRRAAKLVTLQLQEMEDKLRKREAGVKRKMVQLQKALATKRGDVEKQLVDIALNATKLPYVSKLLQSYI